MIRLSVGAKVGNKIVEENKLNKYDNKKQTPDETFLCDENLGGAMVASLFQSKAHSYGDNNKMLEVKKALFYFVSMEFDAL